MITISISFQSTFATQSMQKISLTTCLFLRGTGTASVSVSVFVAIAVNVSSIYLYYLL